MKSPRTYLLKAARNSFEQVLYAAVQYGLMMLLLIMLARTLGKPGLGLFSYLNSLVIPIWVAIEFGLDNYLVRDLAAIPHRSHALASQAASVRLVFAIAALVFIVPFIAATQESETAKFGVILLCTAFLPRAFTSSYFSVLRSQQRYYHAMRFDMLGALIVTICAVGILLTTKSLLAVITISASVDFLKCAVVLPLYKRELGASLMRSLDLHITRHKDFIKRTAPFAALNVIVILYLRVDVLLLEHFRNVNDVGVFTAGERFINVLLAFPAAMYGSLLPMFSEARGKEYAKGFAKLSILLFMAIGVIASVVIYYCASFAIGVTFQFPESVVVLQILGWSFAFNIFNLISESWLYGNGLERRVLAARFIGLVVIIAMNCYFAPLWGATGTAFSTTITEIVLSLIFAAILYHAFKTNARKKASAAASETT